eukprot:2545159-Pyramimonas_sp.AAC.1
MDGGALSIGTRSSGASWKVDHMCSSGGRGCLGERGRVKTLDGGHWRVKELKSELWKYVGTLPYSRL